MDECYPCVFSLQRHSFNSNLPRWQYQQPRGQRPLRPLRPFRPLSPFIRFAVAVRRTSGDNTPMAAPIVHAGLEVLYTRDQIARRVKEMGEEISRDFAGQKVVLIGVLKGATIFLADLARCISLDATFDFLSTSSYGKGHQQSGEVRLLKDVDHSVEGQNIILVEDILDTRSEERRVGKECRSRW